MRIAGGKAGPGLEPALVIVKVELLDVTPPALTMTVADPCEAIRFAETEAVNWLALTKVVGKVEPFQRTVELAVKLEPVTVRVKAEPPACVVDGLRLLIAVEAGPELALVIVKVELLETLPPTLAVTAADPCEAIRLAETEAVNWLALTKVVGKDTPFHSTAEPAVKPAPLTVRVKAGPPAGVADGLKPVIVGAVGPTGADPFRMLKT